MISAVCIHRSLGVVEEEHSRAKVVSRIEVVDRTGVVDRTEVAATTHMRLEVNRRHLVAVHRRLVAVHIRLVVTRRHLVAAVGLQGKLQAVKMDNHHRTVAVHIEVVKRCKIGWATGKAARRNFGAAFKIAELEACYKKSSLHLKAGLVARLVARHTEKPLIEIPNSIAEQFQMTKELYL